MTTLQLRASDGNTLSAYVVRPEGTPRGAVVVVQEIFGVNSHVRRVVEQYAAEGYVAIAPAMFDRFQKDVDLGYDAKGIEQGVAFMMRTTNASTLADLDAAITTVSHAGRVGMVGYCWGGRSTYLAACHANIAAGVAYYGGGIPQLLPDTPRCPDDVPLRRARFAHPAQRRGPGAQGAIRRASSTCIPPVTASTAANARTSTRPARNSPSSAPSNSSASTSGIGDILLGRGQSPRPENGLSPRECPLLPLHQRSHHVAQPERSFPAPPAVLRRRRMDRRGRRRHRRRHQPGHRRADRHRAETRRGGDASRHRGGRRGISRLGGKDRQGARDHPPPLERPDAR